MTTDGHKCRSKTIIKSKENTVQTVRENKHFWARDHNVYVVKKGSIFNVRNHGITNSERRELKERRWTTFKNFVSTISSLILYTGNQAQNRDDWSRMLQIVMDTNRQSVHGMKEESIMAADLFSRLTFVFLYCKASFHNCLQLWKLSSFEHRFNSDPHCEIFAKLLK